MKILNTILLIIINIAGISYLNAQENITEKGKEGEIEGRVLDMSTKGAIIFATIGIKNKNNGVIADDEGNFRLPLKYKIQNDTIMVSSIGYKTLNVAMSTLSETALNIIELKPKVESLSAVTIIAKKNSPKDYIPVREIVKSAIERIRLNFPTNPHSYIGYYRDYQILESKYFNLNESILQVFDSGFQTNKLLYKDNQTALYNYKLNTEFEQDSSLTKEYNEDGNKFIKNATISGLGGNELNILNLGQSKINTNKNIESKYWINTPLKNTKNENRDDLKKSSKNYIYGE